MLKFTLLTPAIILTLLTSMATSSEISDRSKQRTRNPLVRVVTISQDGLSAEPGKPLLDATITRLNRAASFDPDIACLPEAFTRGEPETIPGPTTNRLATWAKEHACYVICPLLVRDGHRTFNSAVLIDRGGAIVGRYDKIRPTENELERSICPALSTSPSFKPILGRSAFRSALTSTGMRSGVG